MPGERLPMRKLRDVLRLHAAGLSKRRIAVSLDVGATSVGSYLRRARRASLSWPLPDGLSDEDLERLLFPPSVSVSPDRRPLPDWPALHGELRKSGVTLSLLWEEYREVYPEGYASILIPSQLPVAKWHNIIGEPTFADAILDRIVHNAHRLELDGPSMRKIEAEKNGIATIDQTEGR